MSTASQTDQILRHLRSGKHLTAIEALNRFNCFRLAARIKDLKDDGHASIRGWSSSRTERRWRAIE